MSGTAQRRMRVGIAGLGTAATSIVPEISKHPHLELVAAADTRQDALDRFRSTTGGETYTSVEALCASKNVDAIYIATPNHFHAQHSILAAEHGKQVIVEKPMGLTLEECDAMIEAAERNGVRLLAGHTHSFDAPIHALHEVVQQGTIGDVLMVNQWYYTDWMYRGRMPEELDESKGGGVVFRQGPHGVDIIRLVAGGMVRSVRASTNRLDTSVTGSGGFVAFLEFENGISASVVYSGYAHFDSSELTYGVSESGSPRPVETHLAVRRQLDQVRQTTGEVAFKNGMRVGGALEGQWLQGMTECADDVRRHPFFGITVVSGTHGDVRQTPDGLMVYGDKERYEIKVPRAALEREAELEVLYQAWANNQPLAGHDGRWGKATLEVCLGIVQSAREKREVSMKYQVPAHSHKIR